MRGTCGRRPVVLHDVLRPTGGPSAHGTFEWADQDPRQGVHLRLPHKTLVFHGSDRNRVWCVPRARGDLLLVGSGCSGSVCGEMLSYTIVDPRTGAIYPPRSSMMECDHACANRRLGLELVGR